jgi:hypothetical protein
MLRKLTLLGAVAVAAAASTSPTYAALPVPAGNVTWISGSTALDNAFKHLMILTGVSPCVAGTINTYEDSNKGNPYAKSNLYTVINCTILNPSPIAGIPAGANWAFVKESSGGSLEGTTPVALNNAAHKLNFFDPQVAPAGCVAAAGVPYSVAHDLAFTDNTSCTPTISAQIPEIGLADENPHVFTIGPNAVNTTILGNLTTNLMFQNMFGVGVSLDLYRALQRQQGLSGTVACPANSDLLSCMPSLSWSTVRTLMSNSLGSGSWTSLIDSGGVNNITSAAYNPATFPASTTVFVCRRGDTSGTQAAADIYLYNNRCQVTDTENPNPGGSLFAQATTTVANCANLPAGESPEDFGCTWAAVNVGDTVFPGTGTGDVAKCLAAHDSNKTFAIGIIATNNAFGHAGGAPGVGDYRMVAIDGGHPTVQALANGTYGFAMDNVANVAKNGAADGIGFHAFIVSKMTTKTVLGDIVATQVGDANFGVGGLLDNLQGVAAPALPAGLAAVEATPVSAYTQKANGATLNDCVPPTPEANVILDQISEDAP